MAWLMIDQNILTNGKTRQVAADLGISKEAVFLHLFRLWSWAVDDAREDGRLRSKDPRVVADVAEWDGDPDAFVEALITAGGEDEFGFLERKSDGALYIHDWQEYTGKFVAKRRADAERKRESRAKSKGQEPDPEDAPQDSVDMSHGRPEDVTRMSEVKSKSESKSDLTPAAPARARAQEGPPLRSAEHEAAERIREVPGLAPFGPEDIVGIIRGVEADRASPFPDSVWLVQAANFRDYWLNRRKSQPRSKRWTGGSNAIRNWYERVRIDEATAPRPIRANGRAERVDPASQTNGSGDESYSADPKYGRFVQHA